MAATRPHGGSLPVLELDRIVPEHVLARRGGISFTSPDCQSRQGPRLERRGGVSYPDSDKNAKYVRQLGDIKGRSKLYVGRECRRRSLVLEQEAKILERVKLSQYRTRCGVRFHTAQCLQRKKRIALRISSENEPILDKSYGGQAQCLLSTAAHWHFNIFNLDKLTNGRPLFHMGVYLFQKHGFIDEFNLDIVKVMRCFTMIEEGYHCANPYHNAVHATDVTQAMHCYLTESKIAHCLSPMEAMVALLASATHDLDHPGVNQSFLVATSNHLAALYKNSSVLENHHWRSAVGVLRESGVFDHFTPEQWYELEWQLRSLILATDISRQLEFLSRFKTHLDCGDLNLNNHEHRHLMLQIALKCADICNPCRPWIVSKKWAELVCDEFFKQGDFERQLQLPLSPQCDRYTTTVAKIQVGFMQHVVLPLFSEWQKFNPTMLSQIMLNNIQANKSSWEQIINNLKASNGRGATNAEALTEKELDSECLSSERDNSSEDGGGGGARLCVTETALIHMEDTGSGDIIIEGHLEKASLSENVDIALFIGRRHSLPFPVLQETKEKVASTQKEPVEHLVTESSTRRHSLPTSNILHSVSLNQLRDKLMSLVEGTSPANGSRIYSKEELLGATENTSLMQSSNTVELSDTCTHSGDESAQNGQGQFNTVAQASIPRTLPASELISKKEPKKDVTLFHRLPGAWSLARMRQYGQLYESLYGRRRGSGDSALSQTLIRAAKRLPPISSSDERLAGPEESYTMCYTNKDYFPSTLYDRPRSLSLEYESTHSMLGGPKGRRSFSGESYQYQDPYSAVPWICHMQNLSTQKSDSSTCLLSDSGSGNGS